MFAHVYDVNSPTIFRHAEDLACASKVIEQGSFHDVTPPTSLSRASLQCKQRAKLQRTPHQLEGGDLYSWLVACFRLRVRRVVSYAVQIEFDVQGN